MDLCPQLDSWLPLVTITQPTLLSLPGTHCEGTVLPTLLHLHSWLPLPCGAASAPLLLGRQAGKMTKSFSYQILTFELYYHNKFQTHDGQTWGVVLERDVERRKKVISSLFWCQQRRPSHWTPHIPCAWPWSGCLTAPCQFLLLLKGIKLFSWEQKNALSFLPPCNKCQQQQQQPWLELGILGRLPLTLASQERGFSYRARTRWAFLVKIDRQDNGPPLCSTCINTLAHGWAPDIVPKPCQDILSNLKKTAFHAVAPKIY